MMKALNCLTILIALAACGTRQSYDRVDALTPETRESALRSLHTLSARRQTWTQFALSYSMADLYSGDEALEAALTDALEAAAKNVKSATFASGDDKLSDDEKRFILEQRLIELEKRAADQQTWSLLTKEQLLEELALERSRSETLMLATIAMRGTEDGDYSASFASDETQDVLGTKISALTIERDSSLSPRERLKIHARRAKLASQKEAARQAFENHQRHNRAVENLRQRQIKIHNRHVERAKSYKSKVIRNTPAPIPHVPPPLRRR